MYSRYIKTVVDYIASFLALIILSPLFILTAFLIKTTSPGPIFFIQKRIGKNGKPFNLLKFRTMYLNNNRYHRQVVEGDPEITLIGNMLRKLKIDETPQLINVLLGEMSLVGPRPVMHHHLNDMTEGDIIRFEVKPGLTGLAQVNGNINLTWKSRWNYDKRYVQELSFKQDMIILMKTIMVVILGEKFYYKQI